MSMQSRNDFRPNWASAPGETIADLLNQRGMSVSEFSRVLGETLELTNEILEGRAAITIGIARKLERALGASVQFWMSRDFHYREGIGRQTADQDWLRELPLSDMIRFGWIKPTPRPSEEVSACLRFFRVPSVAAWRSAYGTLQRSYALRTSSTFESRSGALAAWLRQAEIEADGIECGQWDVESFRRVLTTIRTLTREKAPAKFWPILQKLCASAGVAMVIVRCPSGCRASGAARLLTPTKALLVLSFRYLSDDQFWFSFFHEAGHLVLHAARGLFVDGVEEAQSDEEQQANDFAANTLIPEEFQPVFRRLKLDSREIIRFSLRAGIAPGIVIGQLQHLGRLTPRQLNSLKRRYKWVD